MTLQKHFAFMETNKINIKQHCFPCFAGRNVFACSFVSLFYGSNVSPFVGPLPYPSLLPALIWKISFPFWNAWGKNKYVYLKLLKTGDLASHAVASPIAGPNIKCRANRCSPQSFAYIRQFFKRLYCMYHSWFVCTICFFPA